MRQKTAKNIILLPSLPTGCDNSTKGVPIAPTPRRLAAEWLHPFAPSRPHMTYGIRPELNSPLPYLIYNIARAANRTRGARQARRTPPDLVTPGTTDMPGHGTHTLAPPGDHHGVGMGMLCHEQACNAPTCQHHGQSRLDKGVGMPCVCV
jgi:hypothetical protein